MKLSSYDKLTCNRVNITRAGSRVTSTAHSCYRVLIVSVDSQISGMSLNVRISSIWWVSIKIQEISIYSSVARRSIP